MWSRGGNTEAPWLKAETSSRDQLLVARCRMQEALHLLDEHSLSTAAASLDLALHRLDRELS